jgi:hypothetical protein
MTFSPMRPIKRFLLFACEVGVLVLGFVSSLALSIALAIHFDSSETPYAGQRNSFGEAVLYSGWLLTIVGFVALRRKTRPWKIEYDAVGWALSKSERKLHPTFSRYKRVVSRILVWMPSVIATTVLLFLPIASHLIRPGSQYLTHYRVSIPWTLMVSPVPGVSSDSFVAAFTLIGSNGKLGLTPFWQGEVFSSEMGFGSNLHVVDASESSNRITERRHVGVTQLSRRGFRLGDLALTCWQYLPPEDWRYGRRSTGSAALWQIDCETPVGLHGQHLYAWFHGREADVPGFYKIIEGIEPVK